MTIAEAAASLRYWRGIARDLAHGPGPCVVCDWRHLRAEAAALQLDMAVAQRYSGRYPRGQVRREIPN